MHLILRKTLGSVTVIILVLLMSTVKLSLNDLPKVTRLMIDRTLGFTPGLCS